MYFGDFGGITGYGEGYGLRLKLTLSLMKGKWVSSGKFGQGSPCFRLCILLRIVYLVCLGMFQGLEGSGLKQRLA